MSISSIENLILDDLEEYKKVLHRHVEELILNSIETYWGLGHKVIRYVGVSPNEPYESNIGVKMGNWFMKYELSKTDIIEIDNINITINSYSYTIITAHIIH